MQMNSINLNDKYLYLICIINFVLVILCKIRNNLYENVYHLDCCKISLWTQWEVILSICTAYKGDNSNSNDISYHIV